MKTNSQTFLFADSETPDAPTRQRANLTFKANRSLGRHNWLRLTPAYSRHLVEQLVSSLGSRDRVLDPFCGTGTTALTCAEHDIRADTVDINPFLVWLANAKFTAYALEELAEAKNFQARLRLPTEKNGFWHPPLADIEKWWTEDELAPLSALYNSIKEANVSEPARNLLFSAFCRVAIETASVSFGHQSMSFKPRNGDNGMVKTCAREQVSGLFRRRLAEILDAAATELDGSLAKAHLGDSRNLHTTLRAKYSCVITSPPYPNRMSYIRELRPYMYWLGYLRNGRQAGELDWQAIGGTWGCATSNLMRWQPSEEARVPFDGFDEMISGISKRSEVLGRYVHKYFEDCVYHFRSLGRVLRDGATAHYIVGNSKFYAEMVHTEEIYAALMRDNGFENVRIENIRKRNSKKELFEFVVSGIFSP
ncbi:MAG TPA: SAM-dependent methyltransferase [Candidatus Paceibacterota bacterium]|nr:SAM-dependent methyltransferase [Candidatus Paceibacterota bacterium]